MFQNKVAGTDGLSTGAKIQLKTGCQGNQTSIAKKVSCSQCLGLQTAALHLCHSSSLAISPSCSFKRLVTRLYFLPSHESPQGHTAHDQVVLFNYQQLGFMEAK